MAINGALVLGTRALSCKHTHLHVCVCVLGNAVHMLPGAITRRRTL
jgi:hypothetical protein